MGGKIGQIRRQILVFFFFNFIAQCQARYIEGAKHCPR